MQGRREFIRTMIGFIASGFLVEVEKTDLDGLKKKYPEAFERPYHREAGLTVERLVREQRTAASRQSKRSRVPRGPRKDGE